VSKLVIAGSRSVSPTPEEIDQAFRRIDPSGLLFSPGDVTEVISGCATGADRAGEAWASVRGIAVHREPVTDEDYKRFGKFVAPRMRNRRMAERGDMAIIFWDGLSGGSADMCTRMVARDKPVRVIPMARSRNAK
jgi:hypothetical protein